jgi:hypothetical protein
VQVKPPPQSAQRAGRTDGGAGEDGASDGGWEAPAAVLAAGAVEEAAVAPDGPWLDDGSLGPQPDTRAMERMAAR